MGNGHVAERYRGVRHLLGSLIHDRMGRIQIFLDMMFSSRGGLNNLYRCSILLPAILHWARISHYHGTQAISALY